MKPIFSDKRRGMQPGGPHSGGMLPGMAVVFLAAAMVGLPISCTTEGGSPVAEDLGEPLIQSEVALQEIDRENKVLRLKVMKWNCETNPATSTWVTESTKYEIADGKLWLWNDSACVANGSRGTNLDIVGSWQSTGLGETKVLPSAPPRCSTYAASVASITNLPYTTIKNHVTHTDISNQSVKASTYGIFCGAEATLYSLLGLGADTSTTNGFQILTKACDTAKARRKSDNKIATISSHTSKGMATTTVTFDGKSCSYTSRLGLDLEANKCVTDTAAKNEYTRNYLCLNGLALGVLKK